MKCRPSVFSSTLAVTTGTVCGIALGYFLSRLDFSERTISWIEIPGEIFLRALTCLLVPFVFVTLAVGTADMLHWGKAGRIGVRLSALVVLTSTLAAVQGLAWTLVLRSHFQGSTAKEAPEVVSPMIAFACDNGLFMEWDAERGVMACTGTSSNSETTHLEVDDMNGKLNLHHRSFELLSITDQIMGLLNALFPENITQSFAEGTLLSVVAAAILFGLALFHSTPKTTMKTSSSHPSDMCMQLMRQLTGIFLMLVHWVIQLTALAVIFLLAVSILKHSKEKEVVVANLCYFVLTVAGATATHIFIVLPLLFLLFTHQNPFRYMKNILPAQSLAFGCASSIAALPVTLKCVEGTGQVSKPLSRFILSVGSTVNMNGSALFLPAAFIFMVESSSGSHDISAVELLPLILISTIASLANAPVPNGALAMVVTLWQTMTNSPLPDSFPYLVAIDWLTDRFRSVANVTGDAMLARIIAGMVDEVPEQITHISAHAHVAVV